jgi:hypothetical protein
MGILRRRPANVPATDGNELPRTGLVWKLLLAGLTGPALAALAGGLAKWRIEARWDEAVASAVNMNGVARPPGLTWAAVCGDPVLTFPDCGSPLGFTVIFVTAVITVLITLGLFGGLLWMRRAARERSPLLHIFTPALWLTLGAVCVLLVLNAALVLMAAYVIPVNPGRSTAKL